MRLSALCSLSLVVLGASNTRPAFAERPVEDARTACVAAHLSAQRKRADGDLLGSRQQLVVCAADRCPSPVRKECASWFEEVTSSIPSLVVLVEGTDDDGPSVVHLTVDGEPVADPTQPIPINPGQHRVRVEAPGYHPREKRVLVSVTQKLKRVHIALEQDKRDGRGWLRTPDPAVLVLGGVGLAGFAGLVGFGTSARRAERALRKCSPECSQNDVDSVKSKYAWANVSLGIGVVGVGTAAGLYLWRDSPRSAESHQPARGVHLQVGTDQVSLAGRF